MAPGSISDMRTYKWVYEDDIWWKILLLQMRMVFEEVAPLRHDVHAEEATCSRVSMKGCLISDSNISGKISLPHDIAVPVCGHQPPSRPHASKDVGLIRFFLMAASGIAGSALRVLCVEAP